MTVRRLTDAQRQEIALQKMEGVPARALAERYEVTRKTIDNAVRHVRDAAAIQGSPTRVVGVRISERELREFDAVLVRQGLTRSEALKRMMRAASGLLALDEESREGLDQLRAALNRVGSNVNQIAKACNQARVSGQPLPYSAQDHAEVRAALGVVFQVADQVRDLARSRRGQLDVTVGAVLCEAGPDAAP